MKEWKPIPRLAFAFFGLMLVGSGSLTLLSGKLHYRNHWHAPRVRSVRHLEESPNLAQGQYVVCLNGRKVIYGDVGAAVKLMIEIEERAT